VLRIVHCRDGGHVELLLHDLILNVKSKLNSPLFIPPGPMAIEKKRNMTSLIDDVRMSTRPVASSSRKPMTPAVSIVATGEASVRFTFATFSMSCMTVPNDDTLRGHGGGGFGIQFQQGIHFQLQRVPQCQRHVAVSMVVHEVADLLLERWRHAVHLHQVVEQRIHAHAWLLV